MKTGTATIKYKMSHVEKLWEIFCNKVSKLEKEQLHLTSKKGTKHSENISKSPAPEYIPIPETQIMGLQN